MRVSHLANVDARLLSDHTHGIARKLAMLGRLTPLMTDFIEGRTPSKMPAEIEVSRKFANDLFRLHQAVDQKDWDKALSIQPVPSHPEFLRLHAEALMGKSKNTEALKYLFDARKLRSSASVSLMIGVCFRRMKELTLAEVVHLEGMKRWPRNSKFALNLAGTYEDAGRLEEALEMAHKAASQVPGNTNNNDRIARLSVSLGRTAA